MSEKDNMDNQKSDKNKQHIKNVNKSLAIVIVVFAVIGVGFLGFFGIKGLIGLFSDSDNSQKTDVSTLLDNVKDTKYESPVETGINEKTPKEEGNTGVDLAQVAPQTVASDVKDSERHEKGKLQITFLGDSILDSFRDETGICSLIAQKLDANVYNLAIGGTCASVSRNDTWEDERFGDVCGLGVTKALVGRISVDVLQNCTAASIIRDNMEDFKNTDIFIVEYGINDFLAGRMRVNLDNLNDPYTYEGGLRMMIYDLQALNPNAAIVLCQTSYIELYRDNGEYVGNTYTLDNGPGSARDYNDTMESVANALGTYLFRHEEQGIDSYNVNDTVLDGIHLNENGRAIYAENLAIYLQNNVIPNIKGN